MYCLSDHWVVTLSIDSQNLQTEKPHLGIVVQESWLAKLGNWDEALAIYQQKLAADPHNNNAQLGKMKCLYEMGR